jgi:hypothetical protein
VSVSTDGNTVAIGGYTYSSITVYQIGITRIYRYNTSNSTWSGPDEILGLSEGETSGASVSLSADGNTLAIGAHNFSSGKGITRIYRYTNGSWSSSWTANPPYEILGIMTSEYSGWSVSLSGDGNTLAIGSYGYSGILQQRGITRIYKYHPSIYSWGAEEIMGITASEGSGYSVSLSYDGNTVAIGAHTYSTVKGITRIYKYSHRWDLMGAFEGSNDFEYSGISVSLSGDGNTVAIGAPYYSISKGITRIYRYTNGSWPSTPTHSIEGLTGESSGRSVSISYNGNTVAVGSSKGITRIYRYSNNTWNLTHSIEGLTSDHNEHQVSLSPDGNTLAIGAHAYSSFKGITRIYRISS